MVTIFMFLSYKLSQSKFPNKQSGNAGYFHAILKSRSNLKVFLSLFASKNNLLLTEREGRAGEYWPEVVAVRTERSEVRTKTTLYGSSKLG